MVKSSKMRAKIRGSSPLHAEYKLISPVRNTAEA